ncbi:MAG TPA: sugar transferase [Candidatus Acidoferrales bacterium]|nr:sugar transferase [Candidatus Acidoferrales bacterium]
MKALLICPAASENIAALAETAPLANLPVFGRGVVEHWLAHLASLGAGEVFILATDRPEQVRALVGDGNRWGLRVEVIPEIRELTPGEAQAKYRGENDAWLAAPDNAVLMDHLPDAPEFPMFTSYAGMFKALQNWLPRAGTMADRIGVHEIKPGVWTGLHTHISPQAELRAPCWIGDNVSIGQGAIIGPAAILENNCVVEPGAEISHGVVGTETFAGKFTEIHNSIALGNTLVNWDLGSTVKVPDDFLLCSLGRREPALVPGNFFSRFIAVLALFLTLPIALLPMLRAKFRGLPVLRPRLAVRPHVSGAVPMPGDTLVYHELTGAPGWLRRWPQLWNVARGDFAWIGNRPLNPKQAARLTNDFERLWLTAPIGLISLADAEGCADCFKILTRAHASFYAAQANWRLDWRIFTRAVFLLVTGTPYSQANEWLARLFAPRTEIRGAH